MVANMQNKSIPSIGSKVAVVAYTLVVGGSYSASSSGIALVTEVVMVASMVAVVAR